MGLTKDRKTDQLGTPDQVIPGINAFPVAASAKLYAGGLVAINSSGYAVAASADNTLKIVGVADKLADNTGGANGDISVTVNVGAFFFDAGDTIAKKDVQSVVFASDDHTINLGDGAGLRPAAGVVWGPPRADGQIPVLIPPLAGSGAGGGGGGGGTSPSTAFKARAVLTSVASYTASGGVITASSTGAIGAQDGVTLAAGDEVLLPAGIAAAAADSGPYVVTDPGGATKFVLTRPDWWAHGAAIAQGAIIEVGGEGTNFAGSTWKALCAKGKLVDTDDPTLYPKDQRFTVTLSSGAYRIGAGGGGENLFLLAGANIQATMNTPAGTLGTNKLGVPSGTRTTGYAGTAHVAVNSYVDAGTISGETSTVDVLVSNW